jgi:two-component system response regulator BaeR
MTEPRLILVVEDDAKIADMLTNYLHMHGFATAICTNGLDAEVQVQRLKPALVVLDWMLPGQSGLAVCQNLRAISAVPIIMVTARVEEMDRLQGLETGADDYVCKPFSPREVVARIKALLRRAEGGLTAMPPARGLVVNEGPQTVTWEQKNLGLTPVEFRLLRLVMSRPGQVFSRARLLDQLHDDNRDVSDRVIDSHIKNIRRKLELAGATEHALVSVYGAGYRFE